ncbi:hypothetical protein CR513_04713, partial [Mucuna pruriens]
MGSFPVSNGYSYILLAVDYMSRWVEVVATKTSDTKVVVDFPKSNIFYRFGWCIGLRQHTTPQKNGQTKVFYREIKKIQQKMTNLGQKERSYHLEDALWAYRTTYQTPLGMSPYWIIFSKAYHLSVELEHQAY